MTINIITLYLRNNILIISHIIIIFFSFSLIEAMSARTMVRKHSSRLVEEKSESKDKNESSDLSESEEEDGDSGEEDGEREEISSSDEEEGEERDGMADMMAKILHQQVEGKIPVLAKRKTTIMKELEKEKSSKDRLKLVRKQKKEDKGKFLVVPDHSTTDYERQLRKVATRGGEDCGYVKSALLCTVCTERCAYLSYVVMRVYVRYSGCFIQCYHQSQKRRA